ncbi:MAG TPA: hypothetical protein VN751_09570 [Solirubrobacteraceae bacterium]|jgi:hypothetical protein|nr:hypothetical protein [Solirubrobacteraceae bacterium]
MSDIHISPTAQLVAVLAVLAGILALIGAQAPEIQRYLKIRKM